MKRAKTTKGTMTRQGSNRRNDDSGDSDSGNADNDSGGSGDGNDDKDDSDSSEDEELRDISGTEDDDGYDSDGLPLPKTGKNKKASTTSSMFIGSLNDNHSSKNKKDKNNKWDKNDWVDDKFDEIYGKAKKNRTGQRERRKYVCYG